MEIYVENNSFIIKGLQEPSLILKNKDIQKIYANDGDKIVIDFESLTTILKEKNVPLTFITETEEDVIIPHEEHKFDKTFIKQNKSTYYLYVTKENKLCVIFNKKPSIINFYHKDATLKEAEVQDNYLILKINFNCSIYKPKSIEGKIKVRNKDIEIKTKGKLLKVVETENHFNVSAKLIFKLEEMAQLFTDEVPFDIYNSDVYDIHFNYQITEMPISKYYARIQFPLKDKFNVNDENWLEFNDNFMLLCRPYPTIYGNLSMRLTLVPKSTYHDYNLEQFIKIDDNRKKTIVCLEYPEKAQENGLVYFKWLVEHFSQKFNIYYVISTNSKDLDNLKGYEKHVIFYKSRENLAILNSVDVVCHSHSANYILPFITNKTEHLLDKINKVFLQHGIIGSKDVTAVYGRKDNDRIADLFVVSSDREKQLVYRDYGFDLSEIILTGLPRFDDVIKERKNIVKKYKNRKKILLMPTWRTGLNTYSDDKFKETNYYKEFQQLINNPELKQLVEEKDYQMSLYLHRNFQVFNHLFSSEFVTVLSDQSHNVKDLLAEYQVLITDYSSVGLDFALMHKKVIYFRPEYILDDNFVLESKDTLPGTVVNNQTELINELQTTAMSKQYKKNLNHLYKYSDRKACKRIADNMIKYFKL